MHFAEPSWLWAGAASVVGLCSLIVWSEGRRSRALSRFVAARHLPGLTSSVSKPRRWLKHALRVLAVACLFIALARPQWGYHFEAEKREGVDVLFAVDSSTSMLAQDLRPSRLVRAKLAVEDLAGQLPGARLGLIAFAGDAFLQTPLTADRVAFQKSLDALDTSVIPIPGTNLQSAIRVAKQAFRSEPQQRKVLVLLTDGEDLSDSIEQASHTAADSGIVVHAIGVGTSAGAPIPLAAQDGDDALLRDPNGQLVHSRLDEPALRALTEATSGSYHALGASGQGAQALYRDALSQLPKQLHDVNMRKVYYERFQWPLALGMALWLMSLLLKEQRAGRERRTRAGARPVALAGAALLYWPLATLVAPPAAAAQAPDRSAVTTYNGATDSYRAGDFDAAAEGYRAALGTRDLKLQQRAYYDLGNSLYRQGQGKEPKAVPQAMERYKQAISAYDSALALDGHDEDARYNRDFVRAKLKELEQQQQQQQQAKRGGGDQDKQRGPNSGNSQGESQADDGQSGKSGADPRQASRGSDGKPNSADRDGSAEPSRPGTDGADRDAQGQGPTEQAENDTPAKRDANATQPKQRADGAQPDRSPREAQAEAQPRDGDAEPAPTAGAERADAAGAAGTAKQAEVQPGEAAVPGGLTSEQAARLLDALEGELQQLPSGYAALRTDTRQQDEQARKDW